MFSIERNILIKSAGKILKVSVDSIKEYGDKMDMLAAKMNAVMLEREDIIGLIGGEKNIQMMKDNNNNDVCFISSILETPNAEALVDTYLWAFRAHMSRGFKSSYWSAQINTWIKLLKENLSYKAFSEIFSIYNWFSVNIPQFTIAADENLEKSKY